RVRSAELVEPNLLAALENDPRSVEALTLLGEFYRSMARFPEAKERFETALAVDPNAAGALNGLGNCLLEDWQNAAARAAFEKALAIEDDAAAHNGLGIALQRMGRTEEAALEFARALELDPELPSAYVGAAQTASDAAAGELIFQKALTRFADSVANLSDLGLLLWQRHSPDLAKRALRKALEVDPASHHPARVLGSILIDTGEFKEAREIIRSGLAANPGSVDLYEQLAYAAKFLEDDRPYLEPMTSLLRSRNVFPIDRWRLNFALGKAYDELGDYGRAMQFFDEGNGVGKYQLWPNAFSRQKLSWRVDAAIRTYTPELFERMRLAANPAEEPVLIVGMLRSGSTLVEQILSSHPMIGAAGEVGFLSDQAGDDLSLLDDENADALRTTFERYLERLRSEAPGALRITDKMLQNYARAGLVHAALPNARIIHTRRNPLDNCLSMYMARVEADYAHAYADIAFYYREYQRLMAHWRAVIPPERLFELDYEELVANREPVVRAMLEFLGLPWDDAVMHHEANTRKVDTLSVWQVRQPIYKSSVERWRRYEPWIGELIREFPEDAG
ncbi:MAG TPA: sulfotransferase, partial [Fimbriimonadaceae bacterium]|nr:sulfotransferase [Fimbriimonadaceae bacterium]